MQISCRQLGVVWARKMMKLQMNTCGPPGVSAVPAIRSSGAIV